MDEKVSKLEKEIIDLRILLHRWIALVLAVGTAAGILGGALVDARNNIQRLQEDVSILQKQVDPLKDNVKALQDSVSKVKDDVAQIEKAVDKTLAFLEEKRQEQERKFDDYVVEKRVEFSDYARTSQDRYKRELDDYVALKRRELNSVTTEIRNQMSDLSSKVAQLETNVVRYDAVLRFKSELLGDCIDIKEGAILVTTRCKDVPNQLWRPERK